MYTTDYGSLIEVLTGTTTLMMGIVSYVLIAIGMWKMFEKAGLAGWKALIPLYSTYCMYEISFGRGKGWLFLLALVPCVNVIIYIIMSIKLANAYGKGVGYAIGIILIPLIFYLVLGLGDAQYVGPNGNGTY